MDSLQKSILSTLAIYNSAFNRPLTCFEIFKYLVNPSHITQYKEPNFTHNNICLGDIIRSLDSQELRSLIREKNGFYSIKKTHLPIDKLVRIRIERQKISDQKWKKAKKIISWLQAIPYLKAVLISGSLSLNNAKQQSDIDVLLIVKSKRIWTARWIITAFLQIIGKRRYGNLTKDRICLNHYITDHSLEIKIRSLYDAQLFSNLIPVLDTNKKIKSENRLKEFQKYNQWIKDYLLFWPSLNYKHSKQIKKSKLLIFFAKCGEIIINNPAGNLLEKFLGSFQKKKIAKNPLSKLKQGRINIRDGQLEFHPCSPVEKILKKYNKTMKSCGLKNITNEKKLDLF